ncbi:MAG: hypothetical protein IT359_14535 [Gemmatimonadaceae bacterium]|nr:hypothetical protein [Gemmatimonadaceae bacterium]
MKKSHIPDFSPKRKAVPGAAPHKEGAKPLAPPRAPAIKPQSTSSKSGRRGS